MRVNLLLFRHSKCSIWMEKKNRQIITFKSNSNNVMHLCWVHWIRLELNNSAKGREKANVRVQCALCTHKANGWGIKDVVFNRLLCNYPFFVNFLIYLCLSLLHFGADIYLFWEITSNRQDSCYLCCCSLYDFRKVRSTW